jgi:hypothetical protein
MRLFVDDIRNAPDESWAVARTVDSAISFIAQFGDSIDEISLDHDISHQVGMGELSRPYPCVETFTAVARYIAQYYEARVSLKAEGVPKITIHSSNPMGAKNMQFILKDFGVVPYIPYEPVNRLEKIV